MAQDKIIVGGNVQGNVTSCENKEIQSGLIRKSAFNITETRQMLVYNQCTGQEVSRYEYKNITTFGGLLILVVSVIVICIVSVIATITRGY